MAESHSSEMHDDINWMVVIRKHRHWLEENINPDFGLIDKLVMNNALSQKDACHVKSQTTFHGRNVCLLDCILKEGQGNALISALLATGQTHLVNYLKSDGVYRREYGSDWTLKAMQRLILNFNQEVLIDLLDMSDLLLRLYSHKVINRRQLDFISSKHTNYDKNEAFLEILRRSSVQSYENTINALWESNQSHIAEIMECGGVGVEINHETEDRTSDVNRSEDELRKTIHKTEEVGMLNKLSQSQNFMSSGKNNDRNYEESVIPKSNAEFGTGGETEAELQTKNRETGKQHQKELISIQTERQGSESCTQRPKPTEKPVDGFQVEGLSKDFDHVEALRKCSASFLNCLDVNHGLLNHLLSFRVLDERQRETVDKEPSTSHQIDLLVGFISRGPFSNFVLFLKALKDTNQEHVVNLVINSGDVSKISNDLRPLGVEELRSIDDHRCVLVDCIDVDRVLDRLLEVKCLTNEHCLTIDASKRKSGKLLEIVRKGSRASFFRLKQSLRETHDNDVAELLEPRPDSEKVKNMKPVKQINPEVEALKQKLAVVEQERDVAKQQRDLLKAQLKTKGKRSSIFR